MLLEFFILVLASPGTPYCPHSAHQLSSPPLSPPHQACSRSADSRSCVVCLVNNFGCQNTGKSEKRLFFFLPSRFQIRLLKQEVAASGASSPLSSEHKIEPHPFQKRKTEKQEKKISELCLPQKCTSSTCPLTPIPHRCSLAFHNCDHACPFNQ